MFIKKFARDEFCKDLQDNLQKIQDAPQLQKSQKQALAMAKLVLAADLLDDLGLEKPANDVTHILEIAVDDPATKGLNSEKMLSNLEHKGWVFNADDGELEVEEVIVTLNNHEKKEE